MDDSATILGGNSGDSDEDYYATALLVPYHIYTTRCDHLPCAELGISSPRVMIIRDNHDGHRQKSNKQTNKQSVP